MISYLRGTLAAFEEDKIIIDVGGVGYGVYVSGQTMDRLPSVGNEVKIHTQRRSGDVQASDRGEWNRPQGRSWGFVGVKSR